MAYTDKAYLVANQEGIRTSSIYEHGFDNTGFNGKTYYELNDILENLEDYDTSKGEFPSSVSVSTTTVGNPSIPQKRIQIGEGDYKGILLEKPALNLGIESASNTYVFPLGVSSTISDNAVGFKLQNFLAGDFPENPRKLSGDARVICHGDFEKDSRYDNDVFYNFEGAHVLSAEAIDSNILKFPEAIAISKTLTVEANDVLSFKISDLSTTENPQNCKLLGVSVTANGSPYTDFTVDNEGNIRGNTSFTQDTTVVLNLSLHKNFIYRDPKNSNIGKNWRGLYYQNEPCTSNDNFLRSQDLAIIRGDKIPTTNKYYQQQFSASVTVKEEADYYFSFYIRSDSPAYVYGVGFVPFSTETGIDKYIVASELSNTEGCGDAELREITSYKIVDSSHASTAPLASNSNVIGFEVSSAWRRVAGKTHLTPGSYRAVTWVSGKEGESSTPPEFRVCGMKVEKNMLSPYDYRSVDYLNYENSSRNKKTHILHFDFKRTDSELTKEGKWAISYLRKFEGLAPDNQPHYDSVGSTYFGYQGNSIIVNGVTQEVEGMESANDLYNRWERVIIVHEANTDSVNIEVVSSGSYLNKESKSYSFSASVSDFNPVLPEGKNSAVCNLLLGGKIENNKIITCNGTYRDVWFFAKGLSREELKALKKQYMTITKKTRTCDSGAVENVIILRSNFLQEEK
jgi:hypothetical protein